MSKILLRLVVLVSMLSAGMANPRAEAQRRSLEAFQAKPSQQPECTKSDFDGSLKCISAAYGQADKVDICTVLEEAINGCTDSYLGHCIAAEELRSIKDMQIRSSLEASDKEKGSKDRSCPIIKEYVNSGRGADYVTVSCKQAELDAVTALRDRCVERRTPSFKQRVEAATSTSEINDVLCHEIKALLSECIEQVHSCYLNDEMKAIKRDFLVGMRAVNPKTFSHFSFKECFA